MDLYKKHIKTAYILIPITLFLLHGSLYMGWPVLILTLISFISGITFSVKAIRTRSGSILPAFTALLLNILTVGAYVGLIIYAIANH